MTKPAARLDALGKLLGWASLCVYVLWAASLLSPEASWLTLLVSHFPGLLVVAAALFAGLVVVRRRRLVGTLLCVSAVALAFLALDLRIRSSGEGGGVRVLSFNIQHGWGDLPLVLRQISNADPDVILLQEASIAPERRNELLRDTLKRYTLVEHKGLVVASRLPVISSQVHLLSTASGMSMQEVEISSEGGSIRVFNLHLTPVHWDKFPFAEGGSASALSQAAAKRLEEAERARAVIDRSNGPCIVGGDLNGPSYAATVRKLTRGMADAHVEAGTGFGLTLPSSFPLARIDYVLGRGVRFTRCIVLPASGSDHRALSAVFRVAASPSRP